MYTIINTGNSNRRGRCIGKKKNGEHDQVVGIFDITKKNPDTVVHLKVDQAVEGCTGKWERAGRQKISTCQGYYTYNVPRPLQICAWSQSSIRNAKRCKYKQWQSGLSASCITLLIRPSIHPPVLSACPLHTNSGCGKERRILIGPWWSAQAAPVRNYLEDYWPCAGGLSEMNAIGTQLRDPTNSGLTRWRMAVS